MAGGDTLDLEVFGGVACEFENFSSQVLEDCGQVDAGFGADARLLARDGSKVTLYATAGKLEERRHVSASSLCRVPKVKARGGWAMTRDIGLLLTWRPALAECDFVVFTWESPFPPVLPPVFPEHAVSFRRLRGRDLQS